ncbi:DENN domain-containing protein 1A isoform X2 [Lingula anatina]|uniref:DENN domain-containing protein 1A isoform X2 n=1 Tax=Lingula anatina TaxID=7574 RepID=A0A1S3KBU7_LINAN|nr:DENN domain-containing protein 1A isoform X2 [Lingula anatina]|eukprot:XP_013420108.1 DENN domain-containing protein 1A isoform X2 [Lingula anatina]
MGSRLRENPDKIFEVFAEIARPNESSKAPFVLQTYPENYEDEEVLQSIPKFAFPCNFESHAVDHFTFVFTDIESKYRFGFCRHAAGSQTCLCIISFLPWYEIFYKLLNLLADILNKDQDNNIVPLLQALHEHQPPEKPGDSIIAVSKDHDYKHEFIFESPNINRLPTIPQNRNLTEYYNAVDPTNMMVIFANMLYERRILITSNKLSRLTACVHGCASLIYPMHWQHLYIPVLPEHLLDYVSAPMPYLIGIHASLMEKARKMELGDAVVLDADKNTIETEHDDIATLPPEIVSSLKKRLRSQQADKLKNHMITGDGVARAFLKALVGLIGNYRDALKFRQGEQITFDPDAFVQSRSQSMQPFLEKMLQLQIFQQFINERLDLLNGGEGFSDEFEQETNMWADRNAASSLHRYKEWLGNMKKQGKKIKREGKDRWTVFTSKANPLVRNAFSSVKVQSKKAYKDLRNRIEDFRKDDTQTKPAIIPSTELRTERPPRPPPPSLSDNMLSKPLSGRTALRRRSSYENPVSFQMSDSDDDSSDHVHLDLLSSQRYKGLRFLRAKQYRVLTLDQVADDSVLPDDPKRISLDLLQDPDIENVLQRSLSMEDLLTDSSEDERSVELTKKKRTPEETGSAETTPIPAPRRRRKKKDEGTNSSNVSCDSSPSLSRAQQGDGDKSVDFNLIKLESVEGEINSSQAGPALNVDDHERLQQTSPLPDELSKRFDGLRHADTSDSDLDDYQAQKISLKPAYPKDTKINLNRAPAFRKSLYEKPRSVSRSDSDDPTSPGHVQGSTAQKPVTVNVHDLFDPLLANQFSPVGGPSELPQSSANQGQGQTQSEVEGQGTRVSTKLTEDDTNLLKEWNLNFDKAGNKPGLPNVHSAPNLLQQPQQQASAFPVLSTQLDTKSSLDQQLQGQPVPATMGTLTLQPSPAPSLSPTPSPNADQDLFQNTSATSTSFNFQAMPSSTSSAFGPQTAFNTPVLPGSSSSWGSINYMGPTPMHAGNKTNIGGQTGSSSIQVGAMHAGYHTNLSGNVTGSSAIGTMHAGPAMSSVGSLALSQQQQVGLPYSMRQPVPLSSQTPFASSMMHNYSNMGYSPGQGAPRQTRPMTSGASSSAFGKDFSTAGNRKTFVYAPQPYRGLNTGSATGGIQRPYSVVGVDGPRPYSSSSSSLGHSSFSSTVLQPQKPGEKLEKDPFADLLDIKSASATKSAQQEKPAWEKFD